jgi:hypothetical protein
MASSQPLTASAAPVTPAAQAIQASPVLAGAAYQPQVPVAAMVAQPVAYGVPSAGYGGAPQGYGGAPQGYGAQGVTAYSAGAQGKAAPQGYYGVQPQQPPPQAYLSVPLAPGGVWMNEQCACCMHAATHGGGGAPGPSNTDECAS